MLVATPVETVRVCADWGAEGWILIDKADFDKRVHKLWAAPKPESDEKPADADKK
jgi:hypothetical protein